MHTIFLIMGETGSGKDTLVQKVCERLGLKQLKSYTTRQRRNGEADTHIFINSSEVKQYRPQMIAYTKIAGNEYFATKEQLYQSDIYIIDYRGIEYLRSLIGHNNNIRFVTIFINTSSNERERRAINVRHDSAETFYKRCFSEQSQFTEMLCKHDFDYAVCNNDTNTASNVLASIISAENMYSTNKIPNI